MNERKKLKKQLVDKYIFKMYLSVNEVKKLLSENPKDKHDTLFASLTVGCVKINAVVFPTPDKMLLGFDILVKDTPDSEEWICYDTLSDEIKLSPAQLDALREIGNIGAGNSATALSQIINRRIDMNVPRVSMVPLDQVPDLVGGPDAIVVGIFLRVYGKAPGNILFLLPQKSAYYLVDTLMGKKHGETVKLDYMDESALMEIGNILSGAYLNAFYTFTQISMLPSIPALAMDMAGAILNVVLVQLGQMGDQALVMETEFLAEDDGINGHFFLVPDPGSLETLIAAVGVE